MNKKYLIVFFLVIFFIPLKVNAARGDIVYNIDKMTVTSSGVTFSGWAFVHDVDNNSPSITITATNGVSHTAKGSGYNFYNFMCNRDSNNNCRANASYQYRNIAFNITFTAEELATNEDIRFDISVSSEGYSPSTRLMVFDGNITSNSNINVSGQATQAKIIASNARIQKPSGGKYYEHFYWSNNTTYKVSSYTRSSSGRPGMYILKYSSSGTNYCIVTNGRFSVSPGNDCQNGAYASWVQILDDNGSMNGITVNYGDNKCLDPKYAASHPDECEQGGNGCGAAQVKNLSLTCSDGKFDNCTTESYSVTIKADDVPTNLSTKCPHQLSGAVTASIRRTETAEMKFHLEYEPNPLLTGTGFTYRALYTNETYYEYDKEPECPELYYSEEYEIQRCQRDDLGPSCTDKNGVSWISYDSGCRTVKLTSNKCKNKNDAEKIIEKEIASHYNGIDANSDVTFADGGTSGKINCSSPSPSTWSEGEKLTATCSYELDNANINRATAEIVYGDYSNMDKYDETYINEGKKYFIPIDTPTGEFQVSAIFQNLAVQGMNKKNAWSIVYECGVNCINKYNCDKEGNCPGPDPDKPNNGKDTDIFGFYYRPITLNEPFPNRKAGENWFTWIKSIPNQERLINTYNTNPEYVVVLTNQTISEIRSYNKQAGTYLDKSINYDGTSNFLKQYSNIVTEKTTEKIYELGRGPLG